MSDDVKLIKEKLDIVDFIGEYVQLKPAGSSHKGLCPFHREKTPSFMVNRERQNWHCFGCSKGGDIFSFLQEIEGMEFPEALKYLAGRAGVILTNTRNEVNSNQRNRIMEINKDAANFFHNFLLQIPAAKAAREYLERRQLKNDTIEEWKIGFAPDQWDLLTNYLLKKNHAIDDLVASGLTIKREGADTRTGRGFYDRFRGRVMFPIWDIHDNVVGFTGRILIETENSGGKYVNTPQTLVYDKSRVVFALNKAKQEIKAKDLIVMVEGQMDVIACHQAGMKNVVATSGTALTSEQIKLLKRYSNNINIAFDADEAGQSAAKRGIDLVVEQGMNVKIIRIPDGSGKDPDECLKNNKNIWFSAVEKAQGIMDWYFEKVFKNKNINDPKAKQVIANELLTEISRIPYAVEKDHWLKELSARLQTDVSVLREDLDRIKKEIKSGQQKSVIKQNQPEIVNTKLEKIDLLIENLLILILKFPDIFAKIKDIIPEKALSTNRLFPLYESLKKVYYKENSINLVQVREEANYNNEQNLVDLLLMKAEVVFFDFSSSDAILEVEKIVNSIKEEWRKKRGKELQTDIGEAEKSGNKEVLKKLLDEFQETMR